MKICCVLLCSLFPTLNMYWDSDIDNTLRPFFDSPLVHHYIHHGFRCSHSSFYKDLQSMVWLLYFSLLRSLTLLYLRLPICAAFCWAKNWVVKIKLFRSISLDLCFFNCNCGSTFICELFHKICVLDSKLYSKM